MQYITECVFCSLQLSPEISHFTHQKRTIKEGTFLPLINVNNRKTFVQSLPPFDLWVVNFDSFAASMCGPRQRGEVRHKGPFVQMLLWGRGGAQWGFSLMSNIVNPASSEHRSHIRTSQLAPRLRESAVPSADSDFQRQLKAKRSYCTMWN